MHKVLSTFKIIHIHVIDFELFICLFIDFSRRVFRRKMDFLEKSFLNDVNHTSEEENESEEEKNLVGCFTSTVLVE